MSEEETKPIGLNGKYMLELRAVCIKYAKLCEGLGMSQLEYSSMSMLALSPVLGFHLHMLTGEEKGKLRKLSGNYILEKALNHAKYLDGLVSI